MSPKFWIRSGNKHYLVRINLKSFLSENGFEMLVNIWGNICVNHLSRVMNHYETFIWTSNCTEGRVIKLLITQINFWRGKWIYFFSSRWVHFPGFHVPQFARSWSSLRFYRSKNIRIIFRCKFFERLLAVSKAIYVLTPIKLINIYSWYLVVWQLD